MFFAGTEPDTSSRQWRRTVAIEHVKFVTPDGEAVGKRLGVNQSQVMGFIHTFVASIDSDKGSYFSSHL